MTVALCIAMLIGSIAFHEFGHLVAWRAFGVRIDKFAVGFGPKIAWRTGVGGIEWSLRPILLGGSVHAPHYERHRPLTRMVGVLAGPAASMLLASSAFTAYTFVQAEPFLWLGYGNATMAVFNLLPLPPMDGGQALLAYLELRLGRSWLNMHRARLFRSGILGIIGLNLMVVGLGWKMVPPAREKIIERVVTRDSGQALMLGDASDTLTTLSGGQQG